MPITSISPQSPSAGLTAAWQEVPGFPDWGLRRFRNAGEFSNWPAPASAARDFWLSAATLSFLVAHPQGMRTEAIALFDRKQDRHLLLTVQWFRFHLAANVADGAGQAPSRWALRRRLLAACSAEVLCFGQLLTSGDHARELRGAVDPAQIMDLLRSVAPLLQDKRRAPRAILLKDLFAKGQMGVEEASGGGFHRLPADPVMVLDLHPFADLEDYLSRLSSKYRVRYRRARSKLEGIGRRRLSAAEVGRYAGRMHELYLETSRGADFNVVNLDENYLRWLGEVGIVHGYFDTDEQLVGFTTAIADHDRYQAHYLGLDEGYKHTHHLYHNMLYDMLEDALAGRFRSLDYGRTALEIKSSLGAEPRRYDSWLRVRPGLLNALVPWFIPAVFEGRPWQPRSPFKQ